MHWLPSASAVLAVYTFSTVRGCLLQADCAKVASVDLDILFSSLCARSIVLSIEGETCGKTTKLSGPIIRENVKQMSYFIWGETIHGTV